MQGEGLGGSADPITLSSAACMPHAHQVSGNFGPRDTQQSSGGAPGFEVSQAVAIASASRFLRPLRLDRLRGFSGRCDCIGFEDSQVVVIAPALVILLQPHRPRRFP